MSTYTPIATQTLTSTTASVSFGGIPQTYTDLVLVCWTKAPSADVALSMRFNGDTNSNYSYIQMAGTGTVAASNNGTSQTYARFGNNLQTAGTLTKADIQNYAKTTTFKTVLSRSGDARSGGTVAFINMWRDTSAITSIDIFAESGGSFGVGSTFNLYGIITGSPKAYGGDTVTTDGTYWYHTFTSTGVFIPQQQLTTVDYLVVAGGGGGGGGGVQDYGSGGGGAGGLRSTVTATGGGGSLETAFTATADNPYTITVGAGGVGGNGDPQYGNNGTKGSNSSIAGSGLTTKTSIGGGGGGYSTSASFGSGTDGQEGGSGGGAGGREANRSGGAGTANQGYAGGNFSVAGNPVNCGAGGGGAGALGNNPPSSTNGGPGGAGVTIAISGSSISYAGGGGGGASGTAGAGGNGGGGNGGGGYNAIGGNGTAARGGGGGGGNYQSSNTRAGGNGGSGIVILRYSV